MEKFYWREIDDSGRIGKFYRQVVDRGSERLLEFWWLVGEQYFRLGNWNGGCYISYRDMAGKYKVIFEDDWLMVVDKEGGLVTTDEGRGEAESLEKMLAGKIGLKRSGIVHRLDKGTSGLLVVAKKEKALRDLKKQFKERRVEKRYLALVCGETVSEGRVEVPVGRSEYVFGKFGADWKGKRAVTEFRREKILVGKRGRKLSLLTINLLTGRTHQIRVHLSYLRWPLLGDKLYGGWEGEVIKRPFLHAAYLSFWHPESGKRVEFESVLADDLRKELAKYDEL